MSKNSSDWLLSYYIFVFTYFLVLICLYLLSVFFSKVLIYFMDLFIKKICTNTYYYFSFLWLSRYWGLNPGPQACEANTLPLELCLFVFICFSRQGLANCAWAGLWLETLPPLPPEWLGSQHRPPSSTMHTIYSVRLYFPHLCCFEQAALFLFFPTNWEVTLLS